MPQPNRKQPATSLTLSASEFVKILDAANEQCTAVLAAKSPTVRIPGNIRTQMRALPRLATWWAQNRAAYTALAEAAAAPRTKQAGA